MIDQLYQFFFSSKRRLLVERVTLIIAIAGFLIHLGLIYLIDWGFISIAGAPDLLDNPIAAAYTPFSFILVYEVYLLVFYIPRSITTYICKQYEIITLIVIRRLFKDLANLEISANWFEISGDLQFTYDIVASLVLFYLLFHFKKLSLRRFDLAESQTTAPAASLQRFILLKKGIAVVLVPILFGVAVYTFSTWAVGIFDPTHSMAVPFSNVNSIFFDEFFTILIIVDVMLLLFSFFLADDFHKIIRNSGFIVSTILIRLSFSVEGLISVVLVVSSVLFGLLILLIFYKYEENTESFGPRLN